MPALLGFASPPGGVLGSLQALPELITQTHLGELALGALALAILSLMPKAWRRFVPPQLLALVLGTLLAIWALGAGSYRAIGEIATGLPSIRVPSFSLEQRRTIPKSRAEALKEFASVYADTLRGIPQPA